jgi:hypothetical protein
MSFIVEEELEKARRQLEEAQKRGEKVYIDFPPEIEKQMEKELKRSKRRKTPRTLRYLEGETCYVSIRTLRKSVFVRRYSNFDELVADLKRMFSEGMSENEITVLKEKVVSGTAVGQVREWRIDVENVNWITIAKKLAQIKT